MDILPPLTQNKIKINFVFQNKTRNFCFVQQINQAIELLREMQQTKIKITEVQYTQIINAADKYKEYKLMDHIYKEAFEVNKT